VGEREVFQYRQAIVPLIRLDGALGGKAGVDAGDSDHHELPLVVSSRGSRTVAIVVTEIVDIVDDDVTRHSQIDDRGVVGSTVLGDRVTELLDLRQVLLSGDPFFFDDDTTAADVPMFDAGPTAGPDAVRAALGTVGV
jgi:two-component system chemotaxis sensor kinase CheA